MRVLRHRIYRPETTPFERQCQEWLRTGVRNAAYYLSKIPPEALWCEHADDIVAEWISKCPGTRPLNWWRYDAPESRRRLGGVGEPSSPYCEFGVPIFWYMIGGTYPANAIPIDAVNPPTFESQAAYLKRHDLLLLEEATRVGKADYEPEIIF